MTAEQRRWCVEQDVTLDGQRAVVCGRLNPFATVASLDGRLTAEFAWPTVLLIIQEKEGRFQV